MICSVILSSQTREIVILRNLSSHSCLEYVTFLLLLELQECWKNGNVRISEAATGNVLGKRCSKKFRKFYRKTPALESLFNKVAGLQTCNIIKKKLQHRCFPVEFVKFLRTHILKNICETNASETL